jgi:hypothetical protein
MPTVSVLTVHAETRRYDFECAAVKIRTYEVDNNSVAYIVASTVVRLFFLGGLLLLWGTAPMI